MFTHKCFDRICQPLASLQTELNDLYVYIVLYSVDRQKGNYDAIKTA